MFWRRKVGFNRNIYEAKMRSVVRKFKLQVRSEWEFEARNFKSQRQAALPFCGTK